jgi:hypothetical protein
MYKYILRDATASWLLLQELYQELYMFREFAMLIINLDSLTGHYTSLFNNLDNLTGHYTSLFNNLDNLT